jgi:hypothetical protein
MAAADPATRLGSMVFFGGKRVTVAVVNDGKPNRRTESGDQKLKYVVRFFFCEKPGQIAHLFPLVMGVYRG